MKTTLLLLLVVLVPTLGACHSGSSSVEYQYVTLKTGPKGAELTAEQRQAVFAGHMSNMKRLAEEKHLVIAGPFAKPADPTWRGIFVIDAPAAKARELVATDPGVIAGVFAPELTPMRASPGLRQMLELDRARRAAREADPAAAKPDPTKPPPDIRAYVMMTAQDANRAARAIAASEFAGKIVWCGRFEAPRGGAGVFVLDATTTAPIRSAIDPHDPGAATYDEWWSDALLTRLPPSAGKP